MTAKTDSFFNIPTKMESFAYKAWLPLMKGSVVDIIAPAGSCDPSVIEQLKILLQHWELIPRVPTELFGPDLLCANTDEQRFQQLRTALLTADSHAVWCLRGGYGCTRLIPNLLKLTPPKTSKLFIGFSDITVLHLFLQQKWHWQTLHGPSIQQVANNFIDPGSIEELKKLIFGKLNQLQFSLTPCNRIDHPAPLIRACLTGGTLSLVQASLATDWQIEMKDKILFLEEVNEPAYRIDRMLQHLQQSGLLHGVKGILWGDFIPPKQSSNDTLIQSVLSDFSQQQPFPVLHCPGIGHGKINRSLPLATEAALDLKNNQLTIKITG